MDELLEKYPYLKQLKNKFIFVLKEQYDKYKTYSLFEVDGISISPYLLSDLFNNEEYRQYLDMLANGEIETISYRYIFNGDTMGNININMTQILKAVKFCISKNTLKLNSIAFLTYNFLLSNFSFGKLISNYDMVDYTINMDNTIYSIPAKNFLHFMQLSEEEYTSLLANDKIYEIKKEYFLYALVKFFEKEKIFEKYLIPDEMLERYNSILSYSVIDFESVDKLVKTTDENLEKTNINEELLNAILKDMPTESTKLEKAIYIYIKMCKLLTYDDEFYAANQSGEVARKHEDISKISSITMNNNRVVCYEFNQIYAKLLNMLGIKYEIESKLVSGFGGGHANLTFREGKYLVLADSVTSILQGDIINAKLGKPLSGLVCKNQNVQSKQEFQATINKVYQLVNSQSVNTSTLELDTFDSVMEEYISLSDNDTEISLDEKYDIFFKKINEASFSGIDALSYSLHLRKMLFTELQRQDNIFITLIKMNNLCDRRKPINTCAIITINADSLNADSLANIYYLYVPLKPLVLLSHEELKDKFLTKELEYIRSDNNLIPGLIIDEEVKR